MNGGNMQESSTDFKMIQMEDVQRQEVKWLWFPYIPYGKLTIVQGDPGEGKTTLILNLASCLSKGMGFDGERLESMNVIYQTAEDGLADTVKPRLEEAGADCKRILVIDDSEKALTMSDERLEQAVLKVNAKVLILDPIQAYLGDGVDMNRANEARNMTKRLGNLAEKTGCAIILIGHMNKSGGGKAAYRGIGSIDFFAVARSVLLVARVASQPSVRVIAQIKNNLAQEGAPVAFELRDNKFEWIGKYDITVDELLGGYANGNGNKLLHAKKALKEWGNETAMLLSSEIFEKGKALGISQRTLEQAKKEIGIKAIRKGTKWYWELQNKKAEESNSATM